MTRRDSPRPTDGIFDPRESALGSAAGPPCQLLTIPTLPPPVTSKIGGEISSIGSEVTSVIDGVEKSVESQYPVPSMRPRRFPF